MNADERLQAIQSTGYWRVNIRPTRYEPERIPSLSKCWEIVETSKVSLRVWDYPHIDHDERNVGDDWISSGYGVHRNVEYWRLYQSGQFIHHFAMWEDYERPSRAPAPDKYLEPMGVLYRITEIWEFAARLAAKDVLVPAAEFTIQLFGTNGRELMFWDFLRFLPDGSTCSRDEVSVRKTVDPPGLLSSASDLALDVCMAVFERFNWMNPPRGEFADEQTKFLERGLR